MYVCTKCFHYAQEKCILNKLKYINYQHRFHLPASSTGRNVRHMIWLVTVRPTYGLTLRRDFYF